MPLFKIEAINIKVSPFSEQDKLLTIFSKEKGKLSVIAKGARRPASKFGGRTEIFAYNSLLVSQGRNLDILSQAETIENFQKIRDNPEAFAAAAYIVKVLAQVLEEGAPSPALFLILLGCLKLLQAAIDPQFVVLLFEIKLAEAEGFFPIFDRCSNCSRKLIKIPEKIIFSDATGGILCSRCKEKITGYGLMEFATLKTAEKLKNLAFYAVRDMAIKNLSELISPRKMGELEKWLVHYIGRQIDKDISAWRPF